MVRNRHRSYIVWIVLALVIAVSAVSFVGAQESASPYLGITIQADQDGAKVEAVMPDSPADAAGLLAGDIITAVEGDVVTADSIREVLATLAVGDTINLSVTRDDEKLELKATLADRPADGVGRPFLQMGERPVLGVRLEDSDNGPVIREVSAGSGAEKVGLKVGDIIKKIGDVEIEDARSAVETLQQFSAGDDVAVEVERDGKRETLEVTLGSAPLSTVGPLRDRLGITYNGADKTWQLNGLPEDSALYQAGLRDGDVITQFDGNAYGPVELRNYLNEAGDKEIALTVQRDGSEEMINVTAETLSGLTVFNFNFGGGFGDQLPFAPMMGMGGARLGVEFVTLNADTAKEYDVKETVGALVTQVATESAAEKAGLQINDVITAVDGDKVDEEHTLRDRLIAYEAGDTVKLEVVRAGATMQLEATLEEMAMSDFMPFFGDEGFHFQFPQEEQSVQPDGPRL